MKKFLLGTLLLSTVGLNAQIVTFTYTGDLDSLIIPNCVDSVLISAWGAQGGETMAGGVSGKGAFVSAKMDVSPGDKLYVYVGGQDGYNGGGMGGFGTASDGISAFAGNGGGASDIRVGGIALSDRKIVAGGGGGAGRHYWNGTCMPCGMGGDGGEGGVASGGTGFEPIDGGYGTNPGGAGTGGTQSAGGNAGVGVEGNPGTAGGLGIGGIGGDGSFSVSGGGGGGGYYGGGGGASSSFGGSGVGGSGGGGGSSYYDPATTVFVNASAGIRSGNGQVTITYILSTPIMTFAVAADGASLTAMQNGVSYQWLNCGTGYSVVPGATNQTLVASSNGSYAVELDNGNGCVDTSACFNITEVGITESEYTAFDVFPNPANDQVTVSLYQFDQGMIISLIDVSGRVVLTMNPDNTTETLDLSKLDAGMYLVRLTTADGQSYQKNILKN